MKIILPTILLSLHTFTSLANNLEMENVLEQIQSPLHLFEQIKTRIASSDFIRGCSGKVANYTYKKGAYGLLALK